MRAVLFIAPAALALSVGSAAQAPDSAQPSGVRFEVASVKPNANQSGPSLLTIPPGGAVVAVRFPVIGLIARAYGLTSLYEVSGYPGWVNTEYFDVRALPPDDEPREQIPLMLQALLADRFKLRAHWEERDRPIYALVVAHPDGRLGPNLSPSKHDCAAFRATGAPVYAADAPRNENGRMLCTGPSIPTGGPNIIGGSPISDLVTWLNTFAGPAAGLDRPVVDHTGLTGNFDAEVQFAPAGLQAWRLRTPQPDDPPEIHRALRGTARTRAATAHGSRTSAGRRSRRAPRP